jgi:hypothetical protein
VGNAHDALVGRKLRELQLTQIARNGLTHLKFELDEVAAIRKLAIDTFGAVNAVGGASVALAAGQFGVYEIGYFTGPRRPDDRADARRPRQVMFRGRTHAELAAQVQLWKANR